MMKNPFSWSKIKKRLGRVWRGILVAFDRMHPKVGLAVIIIDGNNILLGERTGSDVGSGCWQLAGGHLEYGETFYQGAAREVFEETGLRLLDMKTIHISDEIYPRQVKHYATVWIAAKVLDANELQQDIEPDKCKSWRWFNIDKLPTPLFEGGDILTTGYLQKLIGEW